MHQIPLFDGKHGFCKVCTTPLPVSLNGQQRMLCGARSCARERHRQRYHENKFRFPRPDRPCLVCDVAIPGDKKLDRKFCSAKCSRVFNRLKSTYKIPLEDYKRALVAQAGVCPACQVPFRAGERQHIDHCHETGALRGVIHQWCNASLGMLKEDPVAIRNLADYAERAALIRTGVAA